MEFKIEQSDDFKISIYVAPEGEVGPMGDPIVPILSCIRIRPFIKEEVYELSEESLIGKLIDEFKLLGEVS